jgi:hypothetical protein
LERKEEREEGKQTEKQGERVAVGEGRAGERGNWEMRK